MGASEVPEGIGIHRPASRPSTLDPEVRRVLQLAGNLRFGMADAVEPPPDVGLERGVSTIRVNAARLF